jgi:hypothetical protein
MLTACQKEFSNEDGSLPVPSSLLVTYKQTAPGLSLVSNFKYNTARAVIEHKQVADASPVFILHTDISATRSGSNQLVSNVIAIATLNTSPDPFALDKRIFRDVSGKITYYIVKTSDSAIDGYDSILCNYNASNQISQMLVYLVSPNGLNAEPIQRIEFAYASDNLISSKSYALPGTLTGGELEESATFTFDNKPAAMPLNTEDWIISGLGLEYSGQNNVLKITREYPLDPTDNRVVEYTYTYLPNGKPSRAEIKTTFSGLPPATATAIYTYQ